jgi:transcription initiation factor TFIID subunit 5
MSTATPAASTPEAASPAAANPPDAAASNLNETDKLVLNYLRSRGHAAAEKLLKESIESPSPTDKTPGPSAANTISPEELAKRIAVYVQKPSQPDQNALSNSGTVVQEIAAMPSPQDIQKLISSIGPVGAEEILSLDPTDKQEGFRELEAWVDGSLDMYKVCRCPNISWIWLISRP